MPFCEITIDRVCERSCASIMVAPINSTAERSAALLAKLICPTGLILPSKQSSFSFLPNSAIDCALYRGYESLASRPLTHFFSRCSIFVFTLPPHCQIAFRICDSIDAFDHPDGKNLVSRKLMPPAAVEGGLGRGIPQRSPMHSSFFSVSPCFTFRKLLGAKPFSESPLVLSPFFR